MALPRAFAFLSLALLLVMAPLCCMAGFDNVLYPGETLKPGQSLTLGSYTLVMQKDCNLVLYDIASPVWASNTGGLDQDCYFTLTNTGNAVIFTPKGNRLWAIERTNGQGNYIFVLQKDRNLAIYGPTLFATKTNIGNSIGLFFIESKATIYAALPANKTTEEAKPARKISMVVKQ